MSRAKRKWSEQEEAFIRNNVDTYTRKELADKLGVPVSTTQKKIKKLGLQPGFKRRYSEEEERFILDNYKEMSLEELGNMFGVSPMAIRIKLANLLVSGKNLESKDYVYMKVTDDKYELPVLVADTVRKLAELDGVGESYVFSEIYRGEKGGKSQYIRVLIDEEE